MWCSVRLGSVSFIPSESKLYIGSRLAADFFAPGCIDCIRAHSLMQE